jgi:CheY-like chemotaxis protein
MMMEDLGYTVIEAGSGAEALAILERGEQVDLLFADVVMPGALNGRQLAKGPSQGAFPRIALGLYGRSVHRP